jgi:hypothetical protein
MTPRTLEETAQFLRDTCNVPLRWWGNFYDLAALLWAFDAGKPGISRAHDDDAHASTLIILRAMRECWPDIYRLDYSRARAAMDGLITADALGEATRLRACLAASMLSGGFNGPRG